MQYVQQEMIQSPFYWAPYYTAWRKQVARQDEYLLLK